MTEWPIHHRDEVLLGDPSSNVGILTLWTDRRRIARGLSPRDYLACGNLYSLEGISALIRNVLANPRLRYLVLCGTDASGSGQALVSLWQHGLDERGCIPGSRACLEKWVPRVYVDLVRQHVRLIDLRGCTNPDRIKAAITDLPRLPAFGDPVVLPDPEGQTIGLPSERTGFRVQEPSLSRAWLMALKLVVQFGLIVSRPESGERRELVNLVSTVLGDGLGREHIPTWAPPGPSGADPLALLLEGLGLGSRDVGRAPALDISAEDLPFVRSLKEQGQALWQAHPSVSDGVSLNITAILQDGELLLTATIPSQELYSSWLWTGLGLCRLQRRLAAVVGAAIGPLTVITHLGYLERSCWRLVEDLLMRRYPSTLPWRPDPRGNFRISLREGQIVVEHADTVLGSSGWRLVGDSAEHLYKAICNEMLVSLPEHGAYLGRELTKAEVALKLGLPYRQDEELDLRGRDSDRGL